MITHKMKFTSKLFFYSVLLSLFMSPPLIARAAINYVDADATGTGDGTTWENAYLDLQSALAAATDGDQIWVAEGVYYPDEGAGQTNNDITSTFILTDGVALYGGFDPDSGVDEMAESDWETYITILSGDIDGNDTTDPNGIVVTTTNIAGDNANHVVFSDNVTNTTSMDGFFITAGAAKGNYPDNLGGGMKNNVGSLTLTNVTFQGNSATQNGGGMYSKQGSPTLTNVTFLGNSSSEHGGGITIEGYGADSFTLTNVTFSDNSAVDNGGGIVHIGSSLILTNVTFSGNSAGGGGGGAYSPNSVSSTLTNVTFSGNSAGGSGGGLHTRSGTLTNVTFTSNSAGTSGGGISYYYNNSTLTNAILWGNTAPVGNQIYSVQNISFTPAISYSDIQGSGGSGGGWDSTLGNDGGGNIDTDPLFISPGNMRLQNSSPAIDAGNNDAVPANITSDLDNQTRFWDMPVSDTGNGTAPIVDMGAYETGYTLEITNTVDDDTPEPGQTLTFTIVVTNSELGITAGEITNTLPTGLTFVGPITLLLPGAGTAGTFPTLASGVTLATGEEATVTFPVTVSSMAANTQLTNSVAITSNEVSIPVTATVTISVTGINDSFHWPVFLPAIIKQ
ncbi:MAG: DUF11 domain-containing protein [Gammaproteobacteria bacterium]|nr:DUF11 domain-containing protein [Gammaproteobacteria bacterium]